MIQRRRSTGFAKRLKELRAKSGMSQSALSAAAGLDRFTTSKLEQEVCEPTWPTVLVIAKALGVTPNDFLPAAKTKRRTK